jgi:hypothetical protein
MRFDLVVTLDDATSAIYSAFPAFPAFPALRLDRGP